MRNSDFKDIVAALEEMSERPTRKWFTRDERRNCDLAAGLIEEMFEALEDLQEQSACEACGHYYDKTCRAWLSRDDREPCSLWVNKRNRKG